MKLNENIEGIICIGSNYLDYKIHLRSWRRYRCLHPDHRGRYLRGQVHRG